MCLLWFVVLAVFATGQAIGQESLWIAERGTIDFSSDAPLEVIRAKSTHLRGAINTGTNSFAFTVDINTFEGFNSEIQKVHFLENYLETKQYPQATFTGKLIEEIPFDTPGTYPVRAKGMLTIHGIARERIIRGSLTVNGNGGTLQTTFTVPVSDHGIDIPRIVQQKIAEQIEVKVDVPFRKSGK
jgi:polyisoprenoid-binding protein YceI